MSTQIDPCVRYPEREMNILLPNDLFEREELGLIQDSNIVNQKQDESQDMSIEHREHKQIEAMQDTSATLQNVTVKDAATIQAEVSNLGRMGYCLASLAGRCKHQKKDECERRHFQSGDICYICGKVLEGNPAVHFRVCFKNTALFKPNTGKDTSLIRAARIGNAEQMRELLASGACPLIELHDPRNGQPFTVLDVALSVEVRQLIARRIRFMPAHRCTDACRSMPISSDQENITTGDTPAAAANNRRKIPKNSQRQ
jgi:hypothetical protein